MIGLNAPIDHAGNLVVGFARHHLQDENAAAIIPWTLRYKFEADLISCGLCQCSVPAVTFRAARRTP
jgi:hypothetical protein